MADKETIAVEVCYALPEGGFLRALDVRPGTTLREAVDASGVLAVHPEIDLALFRTGIYGKLRPLDTVLQARDRIEIYRPLVADPKEARRRRADKKKAAAAAVSARESGVGRSGKPPA